MLRDIIAAHSKYSTTSVTFRTRYSAIPAVAVNRSGRHTLRMPTRWPWAHTFTSLLSAMRALPGPTG